MKIMYNVASTLPFVIDWNYHGVTFAIDRPRFDRWACTIEVGGENEMTMVAKHGSHWNCCMTWLDGHDALYHPSGYFCIRGDDVKSVASRH
jgi:hypothetical protein